MKDIPPNLAFFLFAVVCLAAYVGSFLLTSCR